MKIATMIGTLMGIGYIHPAPGTWGAFVALPWAWLVHIIGGCPLYSSDAADDLLCVDLGGCRRLLYTSDSAYEYTCRVLCRLPLLPSTII